MKKKKYYGLLKKDLAIVKIMAWSEEIEPTEIYFKYELKHWRKHKGKGILATSRINGRLKPTLSPSLKKEKN